MFQVISEVMNDVLELDVLNEYIKYVVKKLGLERCEFNIIIIDNENPEVVVKADAQAKSSIIMDIMDAAQDAHYKKLIVAGEPLNKKEQQKLEENTSNYTSNNVMNEATTPLPTDNQYENWSE